MNSFTTFFIFFFFVVNMATVCLAVPLPFIASSKDEFNQPSNVYESLLSRVRRGPEYDNLMHQNIKTVGKSRKARWSILPQNAEAAMVRAEAAEELAQAERELASSIAIHQLVNSVRWQEAPREMPASMSHNDVMSFGEPVGPSWRIPCRHRGC